MSEVSPRHASKEEPAPAVDSPRGGSGIHHDAARLADAAYEMVQGVDGVEGVEAVCLGRGGASADGEAFRAVAGERLGHVDDVFGFQTGLSGDRFRRVRAQVEAARGQSSGGVPVGLALVDDHPGDGQGQRALRSRRRVQPPVGVGGGHREAGVDVHHRAADAVALSELPVAPAVAHGGDPRVQEVGPERQQVLGALQIEVGHYVLLEDILDGGPERQRLQRLVREVAGARGRDEAVDDHAGMRPDRVRDHDGLRPVLELLELQGDARYRVRPAYLLPRACAALSDAEQRRADAVGVVQRLEARLAPRAVLAAVDRMVDVALDLLGPALHHADDDALARRALPAQRRVPVVEPGDHVLGHLQRRLDEHLVWRNAAGLEHDRRSGGAAQQGQESSSCQIDWHIYPSSGTSCSRRARCSSGGSRRNRPSSATAPA